MTTPPVSRRHRDQLERQWETTSVAPDEVDALRGTLAYQAATILDGLDDIAAALMDDLTAGFEHVRRALGR